MSKHRWSWFIGLSAVAAILAAGLGWYVLKGADTGSITAAKMNRGDTAQDEAMQTTGKTPKADAQGFYTVGQYRVKVEPLDGDTMKEDAMRDGGMANNAALTQGSNLLQVTVRDSAGSAVDDAKVRAAAQLLAKDNRPQANTPVAHLESVGEGVYRGILMIERTGEYNLAVDVDSEEQGHGDLILAFATGETELKAATATPEGIAYYTCSMHTSVRAAGPGQCPICSMDLVPVTNEEVQTGTITVDSRRRQLIGLETGQAAMRDMTNTIRAVGEVMYDETRLSDVSLRFDAWVGELKADYVGKDVDKGEMLFSVYGPDLLSAQQQYLEVLKRRRGKSNDLVEAARKRLLLWDMTPDQVERLEKRGEPLDYVPIMAPRSGTVVKKDVVTGTANKAGTTLMRIADLSRVWVEADVYESELQLVEPGMRAEVTLPYLPGRTYEARVDYIYPYLMDKTRTGRIRLVLDNPQGKLKPDMYAEVKLKADLGQRLTVPEQAVLFAGDSRVVFLDMGEGKLKPKNIKTGVRTKEYIEVLEGVSPGDKVVISGNFLIAAESRLKSGIEQW